MSENTPSALSRFLVLLYGALAYFTFLATFLYLIGFAHNFLVPTATSMGNSENTVMAVFINILLMLLFGIQHSIMARKGFKDWLTKILPAAAERSTYVLASNIVLVVLYFYWQPLNGVVWSVENETLFIGIYTLCALGWGLALIATFALDHFELFGLKQIWCNFRGTPMPEPRFHQPLLYRMVRHPLQLGIFLGLWLTPAMTQGLLLFNIGMTIYIFVGLFYEEKDLVRIFGSVYEEYRKKVPQLIPFLPGSK
ncbi:MAG: isoprenylcysteine carboxylmethyltransferase family protein [Gammaproteobacteria bacterium]|nr:isoprenylcysteine carboxylmethyltransferase family protein [Gammaproteobacteria bacterium]